MKVRRKERKIVKKSGALLNLEIPPMQSWLNLTFNFFPVIKIYKEDTKHSSAQRLISA